MEACRATAASSLCPRAALVRAFQARESVATLLSSARRQRKQAEPPACTAALSGCASIARRTSSLASQFTSGRDGTARGQHRVGAWGEAQAALDRARARVFAWERALRDHMHSPTVMASSVHRDAASTSAFGAPSCTSEYLPDAAPQRSRGERLR